MSSRRYLGRKKVGFPVRALTILFGALPATFFSWYALWAVYAGATTFWRGGIIFVILGLAGIFGTISLWAVAFGKDSRVLIVGLVIGSLLMSILLIAPSSIFSEKLGVHGRAATTFLEASPIVVALVWLGYFFLRAGAREIAASRSSERID